MHQPEKLEQGAAEVVAPPTIGDRIDFVISFLRRRYRAIAICLALALPIGAYYHLTAPPVYTASATMLIETRKINLQQSMVGDAPTDAPWIESQIGVLKSRNVATSLVKQLGLAEDSDFARAESGQDRSNQAAAAVMGGLDARRLGQSYMLRIDFRFHDPQKAVKVANAVVDAYVTDQLNAKYQSIRRAGDWLQERLQSLREQAAAAERSVLEFKAKNNIVVAGGTLMNDKQLSEVSSGLATARARTSDVQLRLERIGVVREAYQEDQPDAAIDETVTEAMSNSIIGGLQSRYLDLKNREADWSARYGKEHKAVVNIRNQIRDIRKSIRDELGRIEEQFKSEFEIAKKRQDELEKSLATTLSQSTETNKAQVALFSLEASAQSYRKLYDSFLQRHTEAVQQQSFPVSEARLLSPASVSKTGPNFLKIWLATIFAGAAAGIGLGALREAMDRGFRTREQVRAVLDRDCLALVPLLTDERAKTEDSVARPSLALLKIKAKEGASIVLKGALKGEFNGHTKRNSSTPRILREIINDPSSPYSEAVRSIKLTLDITRPGRHPKVIGLTSSLPTEGKSTLALAMAVSIAQSGARVMLVDCDLRNPTLSRLLSPDSTVGFLDVMAGKVPLADAIRKFPAVNMVFLPPGWNTPLAKATDLLGSEAAKVLFDGLQSKCDYLIVDLAPLASALDVSITIRLIDAFLLIIEWGATKVDAVQYALRNSPGVEEKVIGAVLNKVNMDALGRYDYHGSYGYYGQSRYKGNGHAAEQR